MEYAAKVFKISQPVGDTNKSLAAHIEQARKTFEDIGVEFEVTDDTNPGPCPPGFTFIFEVFVDLASSRQIGFAPCPIAYSDVLAWCQLNRVDLRVWEVDLLRRLDGVYLRTMNDSRPKNTKGE